MFKNQLQELAQRSCFNLPAYACVREGPDHAPRFKASVNFNGEIFESPSYCPTLRQAEHAAAEVALNALSSRGPSRSLTARVLDETGIYKNLLQETTHRAGLNLPVYTTVRSGPGHLPVFTCTVELAGLNFTGEPAKTKKQAEKNAAIAAWSALKRTPHLNYLTSKEADSREDQDQAMVARVLSNLRSRDDCRQAKRRDHNPARKKMVRNYRDSCSTSSSSTSRSSLPYQHWRLLDLLLDSAPDGPTKKPNSFMSLLPPPPPRTVSKILPPTSPREHHSPYSSRRPMLIESRGKSPLRMPEISVPLMEHHKDEEERFGLKLDVTKQPTEKEGAVSLNSLFRPFPLSNPEKPSPSMLDQIAQLDSTRIGRTVFGSPNLSPVSSTCTKPSSSTYVPRPLLTGGFNPSRLAPAVQIRSVIPVCAAPPSPIRTPPSSSSAINGAHSTPKSTKTGAAEVPSSSFNKAESNLTTQLGYEFYNKLHL